MDICSVRHSSDLFTVYKERFELATYHSDLKANHPSHVVEGQVYDDSCDIGFVVVSRRTGKEAVFALNDTVKDDEDDVLCWEYIPTRDTVRRIPELRGWVVTVIND